MAVCLLSCSFGGDRAAGSDDGDFFLEGSIRGEEGRALVTVLLQGRADGPEGAFYRAPLDLRLDGQPLRADSSRLGGTFYEVQVPLAQFTGSHRIEGTLPGSKTFRKDFTYNPLAFAAEPPAQLSRANFRLQLQGLPALANVVIALTDTAFLSNDLLEQVTVKNGTLTLSAKQLRNVENGPVQLQLTSLQELDLGSGAAGSIRVEHSLQRELLLGD